MNPTERFPSKHNRFIFVSQWPAGDQKGETDETEEEADDTTFDDEKNLFEKTDTQYSFWNYNYDLKYNI